MEVYMDLNKSFITAVVFLAYSTATISAPATVAEQQREDVSQLMADLNTDAKSVVDQVVSAPQDAIDSGCLGGILGLDLSVFSVDLTNLWAPLYSQFKQQLLSQACSAATDYVNSQTAQLATTLNTPLGGVSLTQGTAITDWQSVVRTDVTLSNTELNDKITTGLLGDIPATSASTRTPSRVTTNEVSEVVDKITPTGGVKGGLDVINFWSK